MRILSKRFFFVRYCFVKFSEWSSIFWKSGGSVPYLQNISKNLYFFKETKIFINEKCPLMSFKGYLPRKDKGCARLKCPYDQIFDIHFFCIFIHSRSSQDILPYFNLLRSIERTFLGLYFCEPLFLVPILGWKLEKMTSYSQKYHTK